MLRSLPPFCLIALLACGCADDKAPATTDSQKPRVETILTAEEQANLTPADVLNALKDGNRRFVSNTVTARDHSKQVRAAVSGQFPKAIILSCVDSRVPVEDVFDRGIGDVFVARVAGNFENTDILGSMEFATKVSGAKLVLVLGHDQCGAVKAAIDRVELGNITSMVGNIVKAVDHFSDYGGDRTSGNKEFLSMVTRQNVLATMEDILERSPILKELTTNGKLIVAGAIYDMETGAVEFLEK